MIGAAATLSQLPDLPLLLDDGSATMGDRCEEKGEHMDSIY